MLKQNKRGRPKKIIFDEPPFEDTFLHKKQRTEENSSFDSKALLLKKTSTNAQPQKNVLHKYSLIDATNQRRIESNYFRNILNFRIINRYAHSNSRLGNK